jgi:hypothetical protein
MPRVRTDAAVQLHTGAQTRDCTIQRTSRRQIKRLLTFRFHLRSALEPAAASHRPKTGGIPHRATRTGAWPFRRAVSRTGYSVLRARCCDSADTGTGPSPHNYLSSKQNSGAASVAAPAKRWFVAEQVAPTRNRLHMLRRAPACCSRHARMTHGASTARRHARALGRVASAPS